MFPTMMLAMLTMFAGPAAGKMPTRVNYGKSFQVVAPIPLAELAKQTKKRINTKVQVEGPVHRVCTKKGCWMSLKDGKVSMRIRFKDYGFFVPKKLSAGTTAIVEGILGQSTLSKAQANHLRKEGAEVNVTREELNLIAEGVQLQMPNR